MVLPTRHINDDDSTDSTDDTTANTDNASGSVSPSPGDADGGGDTGGPSGGGGGPVSNQQEQSESPEPAPTGGGGGDSPISNQQESAETDAAPTTDSGPSGGGGGPVSNQQERPDNPAKQRPPTPPGGGGGGPVSNQQEQSESPEPAPTGGGGGGPVSNQQERRERRQRRGPSGGGDSPISETPSPDIDPGDTRVGSRFAFDDPVQRGGQGIEQSDPEARRIERRLVNSESNPFTDPSQIAVRVKNGQAQIAITEAGRNRIRNVAEKRILTRQGIHLESGKDFELQQTGDGGFRTELTDRGRKELIEKDLLEQRPSAQADDIAVEERNDPGDVNPGTPTASGSVSPSATGPEDRFNVELSGDIVRESTREAIAEQNPGLTEADVRVVKEDRPSGQRSFRAELTRRGRRKQAVQQVTQQMEQRFPGLEQGEDFVIRRVTDSGDTTEGTPAASGAVSPSATESPGIRYEVQLTDQGERKRAIIAAEEQMAERRPGFDRGEDFVVQRDPFDEGDVNAATPGAAGSVSPSGGVTQPEGQFETELTPLGRERAIRTAIRTRNPGADNRLIRQDYQGPLSITRGPGGDVQVSTEPQQGQLPAGERSQVGPLTVIQSPNEQFGDAQVVVPGTGQTGEQIASGGLRAFQRQVGQPARDVAGDLGAIAGPILAQTAGGSPIGAAVASDGQRVQTERPTVNDTLTKLRDLGVAPEQERSERGRFEKTGEGLGGGAAAIASAPLAVPLALDEAGEFVGALGANAADDQPDQFASRAAAAGIAAGQQSVESAVANPYRTTGMVAGSLAASAGLIRGASKLSPGAGRAAAFTIQPGEEALSAAATRAAPRLASKFPGGRIDVEEGAALAARKVGSRVQQRSGGSGRSLPSTPDNINVELQRTRGGDRVDVNVNADDFLSGRETGSVKDIPQRLSGEAQARAAGLQSSVIGATRRLGDVPGDAVRRVQQGAQRARAGAGEVGQRIRGGGREIAEEARATPQRARERVASGVERVEEKLPSVSPDEVSVFGGDGDTSAVAREATAVRFGAAERVQRARDLPRELRNDLALAREQAAPGERVSERVQGVRERAATKRVSVQRDMAERVARAKAIPSMARARLTQTGTEAVTDRLEQGRERVAREATAARFEGAERLQALRELGIRVEIGQAESDADAVVDEGAFDLSQFQTETEQEADEPAVDETQDDEGGVPDASEFVGTDIESAVETGEGTVAVQSERTGTGTDSTQRRATLDAQQEADRGGAEVAAPEEVTNVTEGADVAESVDAVQQPTVAADQAVGVRGRTGQFDVGQVFEGVGTETEAGVNTGVEVTGTGTETGTEVGVGVETGFETQLETELAGLETGFGPEGAEASLPGDDDEPGPAFEDPAFASDVFSSGIASGEKVLKSIREGEDVF